jgi:hypothetical protein
MSRHHEAPGTVHETREGWDGPVLAARAPGSEGERVIDDDGQCGSCRFFKSDAELTDVTGLGDCRRYPPTWLPGDAERDPIWAHAMVHKEDWCGEYWRRDDHGSEPGDPGRIWEFGK